MRILILGGTKFLGPHVIDSALARGCDVTILHRGKTPYALPPGVEEILGDRKTAEIERVANRTWDAVIDASGYTADVVERSARALEAHAKGYVFVSTMSVYADMSRPGIDEEAAVHPPDAADEHRYGADKAACEAALRAVLGERVSVVRPGLIVGPYDPTDRFTYWVERLARGGRILAPGRPERPVQFIDVRDLASWIVELAVGNVPGTFNATGREVPMGEVLRAGLDAVPSDAKRSLVWVPDGFLTAEGAGPWMELPLWIPEESEYSGLMKASVERALAAGLQLRDPRETFAATYAWVRTLPAERKREAGMTAEREEELLARYASVPT